jgi:uncharacterized protein with beta-barrel porin domain
MNASRSLVTVLGAAAVTSALATVALWPRSTFADGDPTREGVTVDGTKVDEVVVLGELVKDPKSKTGWVVAVEAENHGTEESTAEVETDITRQVMNVTARVGPMPTAVWKKKEKLTVPAGGKVTRRYDVPAPLAPKIAASMRTQENMGALYAKAATAKTPPRYTSYAVQFRGRWAMSDWTNPDNWSKSPFGESLSMEMPMPVPAQAGATPVPEL